MKLPKRALDLLHIYTGHTFRLGRLAGEANKENRRQIMSALHGRKMPVSRSGVTALTKHLYIIAGNALDGYTCEADRQDKFAAWAKSQLSEEKQS